MKRGFIKLWRKTLDTEILQNHKLWAFWSWCLMRASHKPHTHLVGFQEIQLLPGQFVFGRLAAAQALRMSERNIRTCVQYLVKHKNLTIKATNKFSIITIVNWELYQQIDDESDQQNDQQATNKRPTSDQQVTTNKNEKNEKNEENFSVPIGTVSEGGTEKAPEEYSKPIPYAEIISHLNRKTGSAFKTSKATKASIKARFNDGFTLEDFIAVIDTKCEKWLTDEKYVAYLRPSTLFRPSNFESYLAEARRARGGSNGLTEKYSAAIQALRKGGSAAFDAFCAQAGIDQNDALNWDNRRLSS